MDRGSALATDAGAVEILEDIRAAVRGDVAEPLNIMQDSPLTAVEVGVRLSFNAEHNACTVDQVFPGSCVNGELIPGDRICAVDGVEVTPQNIDTQVQHGGWLGSPCTFTVERSGARFHVTLTRVSPDDLNERADMLEHLRKHHELCGRGADMHTLMKSTRQIEAHYLRQERSRMAHAQRITRRLSVFQHTVLTAVTKAEALLQDPARGSPGAHTWRSTATRESLTDVGAMPPQFNALVMKSHIVSEELFGVGLIIAPTFPFLVMHGTSMVDAMGTSLASRVDVGDELLEVDGSPVHEVYPVSAYDHARAIACLCLHKVC